MNFLLRIYHFAEYLYALYQEKRYGKLVLYILGILIGAACTGLFLGNIAYYVSENIDTIVKVVGSICIFIIMLLYIFPKKKPEPPKAAPTFGYDPIALNTTYKLLRKAFVKILFEASESLPIRKPETPSQLDAPTNFDIINNVPIYHLLCSKVNNSATIDSYEFTGILQDILERKLNNHDIDGISQTTFFYNGMTHPIIMIDKISDLGRFIQIDIAVTNETYLQNRSARIFNSMDQEQSSLFMDRDF